MLGRLLDLRATTYAASLASLALGLFFTFVWAPHPWTWAGIDQYHDLARAVARGEGFNTTDVPWGYAYYIAFFYVLFGEQPWLPIVVQVIANATMPIMLHAIVLPLAGRRTAILAAVIIGLFSFNTVYASTQMSDAVCSPLFLAAVLCFVRADLSGRRGLFALSGLLLGLAVQFRPNLLLLPGVVALAYVVKLSRPRLLNAAIFLAVSALVVMPWTIRNYRLAGVLLPTSSHGAVQLWYGSLQVGPYLENRKANPRQIFEQSPFEYTSLVDTPILVTIDPSACPAELRPQIVLTYWIAGQAPVRLVPPDPNARTIELVIPAQPDSTIVQWWIGPAPPDARPGVYFVSTDHFGDLDRDNLFDDIFDAVRSAQARGERELSFSDGSRIRIPAATTGRLTDLEVEGPMASAAVMARTARVDPNTPPNVPACLDGRIRFNDVFYRRELHMMNRYAALAMDNIRRDPLAFAAASAYRAVRLFVVRPSGDDGTTYRFAGGTLIYAGALVLSLGYLLIFLAGVAVAWRRRSPLLVLLLPIVYVPVTICFVLTNQRYTVTVQPLMFAFVALAIVTALRWDLRGGGAAESLDGNPE